MVKVVQNPNQSVGQIKLKPNPVKIIKLPNTTEGNTQVIQCYLTCFHF